jgi:hypothetical protein
MVNQHVAPRHEAEHDAPRAKKVGEDALVMPLAEPGPGKPLVGATGVKGEHLEDGERDPDTIAEEQRIRSALYEAGLGKDLPHETRQVAPPPPHAPPPHQPKK